MKLLTIIRDAAGSLYVEATRAPDLRRRELSQEFGSAEILFCSAPPEGQSARQVSAVLQGILLDNDHMSSDALRAKVQSAAVWNVFIKPVIDRCKRRISKPLTQLLRALHYRRLGIV